MTWVEIPSQRVLWATHAEMESRFERRGDEGQQCLWVRDDGRVFRAADIQPQIGAMTASIYLTEV